MISVSSHALDRGKAFMSNGSWAASSCDVAWQSEADSVLSEAA